MINGHVAMRVLRIACEFGFGVPHNRCVAVFVHMCKVRGFRPLPCAFVRDAQQLGHCAHVMPSCNLRVLKTAIHTAPIHVVIVLCTIRIKMHVNHVLRKIAHKSAAKRGGKARLCCVSRVIHAPTPHAESGAQSAVQAAGSQHGQNQHVEHVFDGICIGGARTAAL